MASFNGTQIKDTYQGIIKTIDNNTATGTLKELTDGNGNTLGIHLNTAGDMTIEGNSIVDGVIDSAGGNKIGFLFADQAAFPDATTYHGAVAHSHADGKLYFSHAGAWVELALASDVVSLLVDDATIENVSGTLSIKDAGVGYSKLSSEFTDSSAMAANDVNFTDGAVFTKTLTADSTLTFSNVSTGMVKTLIISGDFALTLPSGVVLLNGEYSGTATKNFIQLVSTNDSTEVFATISNHTA